MNTTSFKYIEFPERIQLQMYHRVITEVVNTLAYNPNVVSVYQIGSVSTPGISDVDMVVVLKDNIEWKTNPLHHLKANEKYLFIHYLYGLPQSYFNDAMKFTLFHNYKLLSGEELRNTTNEISTDEKQFLKTQIALEFLLKMYINISLQETYGVIKLRSLLLHIKGLIYDLDFLGVTSGALTDLIQEMMQKRETWFAQKFDASFFNNWIHQFSNELKSFLKNSLSKHPLYFETAGPLRISRNTLLNPGKNLRFEQKGILLPSTLLLNSKMIKMQNRLAKFSFETPAKTDDIPKVINQQFEFQKKMKMYNSKRLPYFFPLTSSLNT